eukprot:UN16567
MIYSFFQQTNQQFNFNLHQSINVLIELKEERRLNVDACWWAALFSLSSSINTHQFNQPTNQ